METPMSTIRDTLINLRPLEIPRPQSVRKQGAKYGVEIKTTAPRRTPLSQAYWYDCVKEANSEVPSKISVGYLSATSSRTSHTKAVHWDQLRGSDFLILTSICRFPEYNPEASTSNIKREDCAAEYSMEYSMSSEGISITDRQNVCNVFAVITETLKKHGSVLLPVCPTGVIYDLLEVISAQLDQHDISVDVPVYLISPVANNSLAYSNICAEWLSEKKQAMVYVPEEPFSHIQTTKNGRLHVYNSISGDFCRQMRTPCVLFTGHPSLRIGDAVHFLEMWGNDSRNAIIITDPDYPLNEVYGPFENLPIRAYFYPIETRLDYSQLNPSIIPDLAPKLLILAEEYSQNSHRSDFVIMHQPHSSFSYGRLLTISSSSNPKKVHLHPEMLRTIELHGFGQTNDFGISSVRGYLSVYDNLLKLFVMFFTVFLFQVEMFSGKAFIKLNDLHAEIRIENNGERTKITCSSKEIRQSIADLISECLKKI
ncbi:unnamed protein product [Dracunculus medinensis]|uniref:Beta-Casp domain-containing protein n=1 Tax=Dracunculus medinensis TaxID=318479 RepID=A0A158Q4F8_DRAME|nr:unnamed protein product [Dracunculus medinensis]